MNKAQVKNIIISTIVVIMGIMLLISLAFPLIKFSNQLLYGLGLSTLLSRIKDSGFSFLGFKSNMPIVDLEAHFLSIIFGVFSILQLIVSIVIVVLGIFSFFVRSVKFKKTLHAFMIIGLIFSLLYMVGGIVYASVFESVLKDLISAFILGTKTSSNSLENTLENFLGSNIGSLDTIGNILGSGTTLKGVLSSLSEITVFGTTSWLSFLFCGIIFIGYGLCRSLIKTDELVKVINNCNYPIKNYDNVASNIELIKKYKELFDAGIISEEEFSVKKKELL